MEDLGGAGDVLKRLQSSCPLGMILRKMAHPVSVPAEPAKVVPPGNGTKVVMPPYTVTWPGPLADDHRIRVELKPPKLPWPLVYYFVEVADDNGEIFFVCEGAEHGVSVSGDQDGADAEPAMRAAEHYRHHAADSERMASYLCRPIPPNTQKAAEIYVKRVLRWRRRRRTEESRLQVRDAYRAWCVENGGRRHGATDSVADKLYLDRKAVRRALVECVQLGEMDRSEIPWRPHRDHPGLELGLTR